MRYVEVVFERSWRISLHSTFPQVPPRPPRPHPVRALYIEKWNHKGTTLSKVDEDTDEDTDTESSKTIEEIEI